VTQRTGTPFTAESLYWHLREEHNLPHRFAKEEVKRGRMGPAERAFHEIERQRATGQNKIKVRGQELELITIHTGYDPRADAKSDAEHFRQYGPTHIRKTQFGVAVYNAYKKKERKPRLTR
jgi:hypothetical protein